VVAQLLAQPAPVRGSKNCALASPIDLDSGTGGKTTRALQNGMFKLPLFGENHSQACVSRIVLAKLICFIGF